MTVLETLLSVIVDAENTGTTATPDQLRDEVRRYVNCPAGADIHLGDELQVAARHFGDLYNNGDFDPSHAPDMRRLGAARDAIRHVFDEQLAERSKLDAELAEVAAQMSHTDDAPAVEAPAADEPAVGAPATEETPAEEAPDSEPNDNNDGGGSVTLEQPQAPEPTTVAASGAPAVRPARTPSRLPSAIGPQRRAQVPGEANKRSYSVVAAADVPRTTAGSVLSMPDLAHASIRKFQTMPIGQRNIPFQRTSLGLIKTNWAHDLTTYGDNRDQQVIDRVADERNLPGGSLLSAQFQRRQQAEALVADINGGCCTEGTGDIWCAPSEIDYTLCPPLATTEGMLDLPTIPINRGGIRYPVWDSAPMELHGNVYRNDCDAPLAPDYFVDNNKTCISGPCPTWAEERLNVEHLCVEGDILKERGYPELTQRFIEDAMVGHAHFMNGNYLAELFDRSDALAPFDVSGDGIGSVADSIMDRLGLLMAWFRERYKLAPTATLEGIAPMWFKEYIKLDLARRQNRPYAAVTDGDVEQLFSAYATRVQWVYDTEGIDPTASLPNGENVNGRIMPGAWAPSVEMVFYPAGAWVKGEQDVIQLDTVYDSTKLATNRYTALFFEAAFLLLNRCNRSFRVRLDGLCRSGGVGAPREIICPTTPAPDPAPEPDPTPDPEPDNGGEGDNGAGEGESGADDGETARLSLSALTSPSSKGSAKRNNGGKRSASGSGS
ncbi:major capsid protein [Nocardiopsis alba]|uniref:major capsid protein n=1 Tax=Nocardiopsis alba TaxID=53437 RepID=UPI0033A133A6